MRVRLEGAAHGSTTLPSDLDIFWPSGPLTNPWAKTVRGSGTPVARRRAGQITQWNQMMSLPITWRLHGQNRALAPSG